MVGYSLVTFLCGPGYSLAFTSCIFCDAYHLPFWVTYVETHIFHWGKFSLMNASPGSNEWASIPFEPSLPTGQQLNRGPVFTYKALSLASWVEDSVSQSCHENTFQSAGVKNWLPYPRNQGQRDELYRSWLLIVNCTPVVKEGNKGQWCGSVGRIHTPRHSISIPIKRLRDVKNRVQIYLAGFPIGHSSHEFLEHTWTDIQKTFPLLF